jgi:hypothetical protein
MGSFPHASLAKAGAWTYRMMISGGWITTAGGPTVTLTNELAEISASLWRGLRLASTSGYNAAGKMPDTFPFV